MRTSVHGPGRGFGLWPALAAAAAALALLSGFGSSVPDRVFRGDVAAVKKALDRGEADVGDRFDAGFTLLDAAAISGNVAIAQLLTERGAAVNDAGNKLKRTPLFLATMNRHPGMVQWLLDHGARDSLATRDASGTTPLMVAVSSVQIDRVAYGTNALGHILPSKRVEVVPPDLSVVQALLRAGADPNGPRTGHGNTALHLAAWWGHADVVALLLSHGADPSIRNAGGQTALQMARGAGKDAAAGLLVQAEEK